MAASSCFFSAAKRNLTVHISNKFRGLSTIGADYVIVGAGSAGSVLTKRLSEDGRYSVLTVETGFSDLGKWDSWKIQMPAALTYNIGSTKYNWNYKTEPQKHLNGRSLVWPRGKVLGGSSSLNAMVYIRGHAFDYDRWETEGAKGWSYADCLPYFRKAQSHELGSNDYRGSEGPLRVSRGKKKFELFDVFVEAGVQAGYPKTDDLNGFQQEGFGDMDMTIYNGERWSASKAYLHPALSQSNVKVLPGVFTNKILFNSQKKATGIEVVTSDGTVQQILAHKEVIICGGAINSPQLLLLSGLGSADHLKEMNIPLVAHLPGVGQNLQDHLDLYLQYKCKLPITLFPETWANPHRMIYHGLNWFLMRRGMCTSAFLETGGFIRSGPGFKHPDIQYHFFPGALTGQLTPGHCHAFQVHCSPMRPTSVGYLKLRSSNPRDFPLIEPNLLSTKQDIEDIRRGVRLTQEIVRQRAFDKYRGDMLSPASELSDNSLDDWIRDHTESAYHPCCTNKMGLDDMAVVDPETCVRGVEGLRVVDASIMPSMVSGNLNAPTIMMAEKAADIILGKTPLPPSKAPVYVAPNWETSQR